MYPDQSFASANVQAWDNSREVDLAFVVDQLVYYCDKNHVATHLTNYINYTRANSPYEIIWLLITHLAEYTSNKL